jgi:hypothetical protein
MIAIQKLATTGDRNAAPNSMAAGAHAGAKLIFLSFKNA